MNGNIPVLFSKGAGLAEAWENSLIELYNKGCDVKTEYDKPGDPPSKDCSMTIVVENSMVEPMIHRCLPGGLEDLVEYTLEVTEGIKDHLIRKPGEESAKWKYTYHSRMFKYDYEESYAEDPFSSRKNAIRTVIVNQIDEMCKKLAKSPYSRRAQVSLWKVWEDNDVSDPPCLQSIWCRILPDDKGDWTLNMNLRIRSNDAYRANFMNMFAFAELHRYIANRITFYAKVPVFIGRYVHQADSYHIYGSNLRDFESRFLRAVKERSFEERTYNYDDVVDIMEGALPAIREKAKNMGNKE